MRLAEALYFRDQLRTARAGALEDAEGFQSVLFCLESMGIHLSEKVENLHGYRDQIATIAAASPLFEGVPSAGGPWHSSFASLYESLRLARNDAVHQGAYARTLTSHAVELALILEDGLMSDATTVSHFMVRNPLCAKPWQPVSFVRQQMLANSFSYLPLYWEATRSWKLVSEYGVARYLRRTISKDERKRRLATPLAAAVQDPELPLLEAMTLAAHAELESAVGLLTEHPILVTQGEGPDGLVGLLAASDIL